jgi:hypothetical protein
MDGWSARGDSNPDLHGLNVPRLPVAPRADESGANGGIRTRTSRLGRPAGDRYPTLASGSAYGYRTRPSALATRDAFLHTQAERGPVSLTGPSRSVSFQRPRSLRAWWAARDSNPIAPQGRTGLRPVSGPSARTTRGGCCFTYRPYSETQPPRDLARLFLRASGQNKKGLLGDRPRRPGSQ